ncbi:MAG: XRE family transcriptional regulator [Flavobacteriales bacterium]|nr:XRE family transcriptional regulator [Flavobacteriales bacterium]|tara:strand:+ start:1777 stop:2583 length:807 start_codon:yes stop_codon:yes gene_type:complete
MSLELESAEVGRRIMELRKHNGYSQEQLAKLLGVSRSSLVQIEAGKRALLALELAKLSGILKFSLDEFFAKDFRLWTEIEVDYDEIEKQIDEENRERIVVPKIRLKKFKNVLLYILEQCSGKPNVGETMLYKLLYFSDFNFYELYEEHLTGARYRKLQFGPAPYKIDGILKKMIEENEIQIINTDFHGFPQKRYISNARANRKMLTAADVEVIDHVIDQYSDWTAAKISEYSHKDMPWKATKEGEVIDYELAFYRETPFSVRNYEDEE